MEHAMARVFPHRRRRTEIFSEKMKQPANDAPLVLVKWYTYAKWILERVESFPKSQRFILGQRLSNHVMDVLETLVKASYAKDKTVLLIQANEGIDLSQDAIDRDRNSVTVEEISGMGVEKSETTFGVIERN